MGPVSWLEAVRRGIRSRRFARACEARLSGLPVPPAHDVVSLCHEVGRQRGRPIHLVALALGADHPCGMWVATDFADFIVHESDTSKPHRDHIIAHELAHILCEHTGTPQALFPDLDPALVGAALHRAGYSHDDEREAEVVAGLILRLLSDVALRARRAEPTAVVARISNSLA
ncbi:hypothetical protein [Actinosynnema sp. NPDC020468]|uniref:hypothetical protein n=1 Tax=Actinosynnema sp. NPDC020468 TaxID=3154488 RepID=UPI0033E8ACFD